MSVGADPCSGAVPVNPFDFSGRVALITGAGTGIGAATARLIASHGSDVVLAARKEAKLAAVAEEVRELGRDALVVPTNVADPDECAALVEATGAHFGRLDYLINNAGGSRAKDWASWTLADFDDMLALNLRSVWVLTRAATGLMRAGGAVVNVSSGASLFAVPHSAPYGAAKAAVNNLTAVMAVDLAESGVRVNCVAPGTIKTEGFVRAMDRMAVDPADIGRLAAIGRLGEPEEIAWPILFLCSAAAGFITGQTIYAGGGPTAVGASPPSATVHSHQAQ